VFYPYGLTWLLPLDFHKTPQIFWIISQFRGDDSSYTLNEYFRTHLKYLFIYGSRVTYSDKSINLLLMHWSFLMDENELTLSDVHVDSELTGNVIGDYAGYSRNWISFSVYSFPLVTQHLFFIYFDAKLLLQYRRQESFSLKKKMFPSKAKTPQIQTRIQRMMTGIWKSLDPKGEELILSYILVNAFIKLSSFFSRPKLKIQLLAWILQFKRKLLNETLFPSEHSLQTRLADVGLQVNLDECLIITDLVCNGRFNLNPLSRASLSLYTSVAHMLSKFRRW